MLPDSLAIAVGLTCLVFARCDKPRWVTFTWTLDGNKGTIDYMLDTVSDWEDHEWTDTAVNGSTTSSATSTPPSKAGKANGS